MAKNKNTKTLVLFAMFVAIIGILAITPLGIISIGFIGATTIHIPVIIGAIMLGPKFGAALGLSFGIISCLKSTFSGTVTGFLFSPAIPVPGTGHGSPWALVIAIVPRVLIGIVAYYVYAGLSKIIKSDGVAIGIAAACGSITNTALVMGLVYIIFKDAYAAAVDLAGRTIEVVIGSTIVVNGVPEAIVAVVVSVAVCKALKHYMKKRSSNA